MAIYRWLSLSKPPAYLSFRKIGKQHLLPYSVPFGIHVKVVIKENVIEYFAIFSQRCRPHVGKFSFRLRFRILTELFIYGFISRPHTPSCDAGLGGNKY